MIHIRPFSDGFALSRILQNTIHQLIKRFQVEHRE